jgi:ribosomal protein S18 acetylase RimI-like enzyme
MRRAAPHPHTKLATTELCPHAQASGVSDQPTRDRSPVASGIASSTYPPPCPKTRRGRHSGGASIGRMGEIEFRSARPDDADAVAAYHDRCFRNTYAAQLLAGELGVPDLESTRQQLRGWFESGCGLDSFVAVLDGEPIAHVTVSAHQLVHLFVSPVHQGTGLGRRLLAHGEAMIAASGHTDLELHARVENVNAIAFYERAGWAVTDRLIHTVEHGISYDEHVLRKRRAAN